MEKCYSLDEEGRKERLELPSCTKEILDDKYYSGGQMEEICNCTYQQVAAQQFWTKYILKLVTKEQNSERYNETYEYGLPKPGDLGGFDYPIPLALCASWIVVFLCLMKGVKSSGKVSMTGGGKNWAHDIITQWCKKSQKKCKKIREITLHKIKICKNLVSEKA